VQVVACHIWQDILDKRQIKDIYKHRKETVKRSFTDVKEQCLLAAIVQNIKKIALILTRLDILWTYASLREPKLYE